MKCHRSRAHRRRLDLGLLALRLGTGGVLAAHGSQKLFGWFGGGGLDATGQGRYSLDHTLGHALNRHWMVPAALIGGAAAALTVVAQRNKRVRQAAAPADDDEG
ncbi:hypothetical protein [Streptomyces sp. SPB074]|uniref:hypothetical protein n=1 Tax=Streptomyces sp. (strain SPB074) TaxID=465543 RepID=UPI00056D76EE|nr:hypothetical protein [Streptomyces sp. SPB074]